MLLKFLSLKNLFLEEIRKEIVGFSEKNTGLITPDDLRDLPDPVRKYFIYCGYVNKEKMNNATIEWSDVYLRMAPDKKWLQIECYQFNSVSEPTRIVYMKSNIAGLISFEGRDKCQNGRGNMQIKLFKIFKIADATGFEMDNSALVTVLAEALFIPSYALQKYITWEPIDSLSARAILNYNDNKVSGIFYFNQTGEFIRFETNDRYQSANGKHYKKIKWSATVSNYIEKGGVKYPTELKATWHDAAGDYNYFKGKITNIRLNPSLLDVSYSID